MRFYLGTHMTNWLADTRFERVPLFVSHRRLRMRKSLPRAVGPWALDSGGFSELSLKGYWTTTPAEYVAAVRRYAAEIGNLEWAAIQDWMCEPFVLAQTGKTIADHQGWARADYLRHLDLYATHGVDLRAESIVGIGSVCRRQGTEEAEEIIRELAGRGLHVHGFGFKTGGLVRCAGALASADSLAWSFNARKHPAMSGCTHRNCNSCPRWALRWRANLAARTGALQ